ncbi:DUF5050 domain-containing protein [Christensenellaceae bacterium OttesenSCG-928-K19]|nr:DUF5050 domain-containing protein [Christensenellaceae bacterium OttesenSCG-928-K19]
MNDIADFENEYKTRLDSAITDAGMPPALLEQFSIDSCIRKDDDGKKELYLVTRKTDGARALLRITTEYPEEDALEEAKLLNGLDHPAIPKVYAAYEKDGRKYLVREYFPGRSLYDLVKANGVLLTSEIYSISKKICNVLAYLHSQLPPVIHRDIKPQNIVITPSGDVKLIDFGIARIYKPEQSRDTVVIMTGSYAAPEQFGYGQTTPAADIYSLGVAMIFMATGKDTRADLEERIKNKKLRYLIEKCIAFDPSKRYKTVQEIQKQIVCNSKDSNKEKILFIALGVGAIAVAAYAVFSYFGALPQEKEASYDAGYSAGYSEGQRAGIEEGHTQGYDIGYEDGSAERPVWEPPAIPLDTSIGNLAGNTNNGGFAAQGETEIYYTLDGKLYAMPKDGSPARLITQRKKGGYSNDFIPLTIHTVNYYDGYIYATTNGGIQKIDPVSGEMERLSDILSAENLYISGDYIYILNANDDLKLYRMDMDGENITQMTDFGPLFYTNISGNKLYFAYNDSSGDTKKFYESNLDGSNMMVLYDSGDWIGEHDGRLYFRAESRGIMCMDSQTGDIWELFAEPNSYLLVTPEGLFYLLSSDKTIEFLSFDGKHRYKITDVESGTFNVVGEWMFYENREDNGALWRIRTDGTDNQQIG